MLWPVPRKIERSGALIKGACNAHLTGTIRAVTTLGGGVNKKTGEVIPTDLCSRSRASTTVVWFNSPSQFRDTKPFEGRVGEQVSVPVRAWAPGASVSLAYEGARCEEGCTQWAAACGPGGWAKPAPWDAGGGPRVHTYKQFAQPNTGAAFRPI
jgi:hypothetical protein